MQKKKTTINIQCVQSHRKVANKTLKEIVIFFLHIKHTIQTQMNV